MITQKIESQKKIFEELFLAQQRGLIIDIQAIKKLDEDVQICYSPDELEPTSSAIKIPSSVIKKQGLNLDNMPPCSCIYIKFNSSISSDNIEKASKYFQDKYKCKYTVYPNHRIDLYSFK